MKFLVSLVILFGFHSLDAQSIIKGYVFDEATGEVMVFSNVFLYANGDLLEETSCDFYGKYEFKLKEGNYEVEARSFGYENLKRANVNLETDGIKEVYFEMTKLDSKNIDVILDKSSRTKITGKVIEEETNEPVLFGSVALFENRILKKGTDTNIDGEYFFDEIPPGTYDIEVKYIGLMTSRIESIIIENKETQVIDIEMKEGAIICCPIYTPDYDPPLVNLHDTTSGQIIVFRNRRR